MFIMYTFKKQKEKKPCSRPKYRFTAHVRNIMISAIRITILSRILIMAIFFVILLWFSILILALLTLHEVLKKYIKWVVEDYLSEREGKIKKQKR